MMDDGWWVICAVLYSSEGGQGALLVGEGREGKMVGCDLLQKDMLRSLLFLWLILSLSRPFAKDD